MDGMAFLQLTDMMEIIAWQGVADKVIKMREERDASMANRIGNAVAKAFGGREL